MKARLEDLQRGQAPTMPGSISLQSAVSTTTCRSRSPGVESLRSEPCGFEAPFSMHDVVCRLPRKPLPRTSVNKYMTHSFCTWWWPSTGHSSSLRLGPYCERLPDDHGALARLLRGSRRSRVRAAWPPFRQLVFASRARSLRGVRDPPPRRHADHHRPRLRVGLRVGDAHAHKRSEGTGRGAAGLEPRGRPS